MEFDFDTFDWRGAWRDLQRHRCKNRGVGHWDAKAESFANRKVSSYSSTFMEMLALDEGDTVLDMGCGTGELALGIARLGAGHDVVAADFSPNMLGYLERYVEEDGLGDRVRPVLMSWEDDWPSCGVPAKSVDVAIASRSIIVPDLGMAIDKLNATARKRVAVTLATGGSPTEDLGLEEAIGRRSVGRYDLVFFSNILFQMGIYPEIAYIPFDKTYSYSTLDEAVTDRIERLGDLSDAERELAREYISRILVPSDDGDGSLTLKYKRMSKWAFVTWDVPSR